MATTGDLATRFGVTKQTVRAWTAEFADYLTVEANPPGKGKARVYNDADLSVMATVAHGRSQGRSFGDIHTELQQGRTVPPGEVPPKTQPRAEFAPVAMLEQFAQRLATQYEGQIAQLANERDYLRQELKEEKAAKEEAIDRAARAEARLEALQDQQEEQEARPGFWRRLFGG
jgi:DNA-binding transcriptional MerR regulator